ncbi:thioesterase family protein [Stygiolobus caldivivus]|uniref:Thioesterase n=1 Tax=Stygiolobus caldivivus TaxID=2824673 RepID=A0A8D5U7K5_9CREN|nr:thioesterase family protein [Stygiolobus caldivivus]BCU71036.1 thioesterase [Stygiolobus caldivivus]
MQVGESLEKSFKVLPEHAASSISSGAVYVLSTPCMIGFMEDVSFTLVQKYLKDGQTTVGYHVDVKHLAPAPIGSEVRVRSTIVEVNGRKIRFKVEAYYKDIKIGEGFHERVIVDEKEFMGRVTQT